MVIQRIFVYKSPYTVQVPPITLQPGSRAFMSTCAGEIARDQLGF